MNLTAVEIENALVLGLDTFKFLTVFSESLGVLDDQFVTVVDFVNE